MQHVTSLDRIINTEPAALTIGTFDGVHLGHQKVVSETVEIARDLGGVSVVFTFSNHPLGLLRPDIAPPVLTEPCEKAALLAALGPDYIVEVPFNTQLAALSADRFVLGFLCKRLGMRTLVVGPSFRLGHHGTGDVNFLRKLGSQAGFSVTVPEALCVDGHPISSTAIRHALLKGSVDSARAMLGRPFRLHGVVTAGEGRGRLLGFPTANLSLDSRRLIPAHGVYLVETSWGGNCRPGVANIGRKPTFGGGQLLLEVHIPGFRGDIYGENMSVSFIEFLRPELMFSDSQSLVAQMAKDLEHARVLAGNIYKPEVLW